MQGALLRKRLLEHLGGHPQIAFGPLLLEKGCCSQNYDQLKAFHYWNAHRAGYRHSGHRGRNSLCYRHKLLRCPYFTGMRLQHSHCILTRAILSLCEYNNGMIIRVFNLQYAKYVSTYMCMDSVMYPHICANPYK